MSKVPLTAARVSAFECPADKQQAFLWDASSPGLGLRATFGGKPAFIFQGRFDGATVRLTIGSPDAWSIGKARERSRELQRWIDEGRDPRTVVAESVAADKAKRNEDRAAALTVGEVWSAYIEERKPHWGELHLRDHMEKAHPGGEQSKRRGAKTGDKTKPGPLAPLMKLKLSALTPSAIEKWAAKEGSTRPASARLAWRLLTVFLTWCAEQDEYKAALPAQNPGKTKRTREALGKPGVKQDVLLREQLPAWFGQVRQIANPCISAALQVMLLTGARPGEVLSLQWADLDWAWKSITIRDKVEGERVIPMTPYVAHVLAALPLRNDWVFSSTRTLQMDAKNQRRRAVKASRKGADAPEGDMQETSATGRISEPNTPHTRACRAAGIEGLTLHGLRRSFASLTEWLETPTGVVAQIQGHKPSATAEKHYKRRPLDLLRLHHERIEKWILERGQVPFDPASAKTHQLRAVGQQ